MWWHHALTSIVHIWFAPQEEVKPIEIPKKLLLKPSTLKGIDLRSYVGSETGPKKKKV